MKINWKLLVAVVVIVGAAVWAVSSVLPRSFSATKLTFAVGSGTVAINNPSDVPVAVQLVGKGSRTFTVASTIPTIAGSSVRQGTGNTSTQLFEYSLPPGKNEFSVTRGSDVNFVSASDTRLEAAVQPLSAADSRTTLIVAAVAILAGLYYISRTTQHRLVKTLLRREIPLPLVVPPVVAPAAGEPNRGRDGRMYSNYGGKD